MLKISIYTYIYIYIYIYKYLRTTIKQVLWHLKICNKQSNKHNITNTHTHFVGCYTLENQRCSSCVPSNLLSQPWISDRQATWSTCDFLLLLPLTELRQLLLAFRLRTWGTKGLFSGMPLFFGREKPWYGWWRKSCTALDKDFVSPHPFNFNIVMI